MTGIIVLFAFLLCGCCLSEGAFPRFCRAVRLWIGCAAGLVMMMWLPYLFAYAFSYTKAACGAGLGTAALFAAGGIFLARKRPRAPLPFFGDMPRYLLPAIVLPLTAVMAYLLYTHLFLPVDGAIHVGQSTYGDLCLHVGIATGLVDSPVPPDYTILSGTLLGYPFLPDAMASCMMVFGSTIREAFLSTAIVMSVLVFAGFVLLAWEVTHSVRATVLSCALLFLNGGLGFAYSLDRAMGDPGKFTAIFTEYYLTPANRPGENVYWVNVICDSLIPQRTLLAGWVVLLPSLYFLLRALRERKWDCYLAVGILGGCLPMIHTHSFLGLGLASAGAAAYCLLRDNRRAQSLRLFALYGGIALALALPQLITWTFPQSVGGSALSFTFNWVNNNGQGLKDEYFWFWIKNVGPVYLVMVPAALSFKKGSAGRALAVGAAVIYGAGELVLFQRNPFDNNKLFLVAFLIMVPPAAQYLVGIWDKLKGVRGRGVLAAAFILVSTLSGALSIGREAVSDYQLFSANTVDAGEFVRDNTPRDAVFLTGTEFINPVSVLAGRHIVCGPSLYLYYHGVDYSQEEAAARAMLENPAESDALFAEYGIDYVYLSYEERAAYAVDLDWFRDNLRLIYESGDILIYEVD